MIDKLEKKFNKLASIWEKPESSIKIYEKKIKVYYSGLNDIGLFDENTPDWKAGFYVADKFCIYLSPIDNTSISELYSDINVLAESELSQLFLTLFNNLQYSNDAESNFIESFGLYESGFRPDRSKIGIAINELGHTPILEDVRGLDKLSNEPQRNLCVSFVEASILGASTEKINSYDLDLWQDHLHYFYQIDESIALRISKQSAHFNIYCIPRDDKFMDQIAQQLEQLLIKVSHMGKC